MPYGYPPATHNPDGSLRTAPRRRAAPRRVSLDTAPLEDLDMFQLLDIARGATRAPCARMEAARQRLAKDF